MNDRRASRALLALTAGAAALPGCIERKISITSEPPGAICWVNDVEVGRTPVETDFTFYGDFDVRLKLDGYEPLRTHQEAKAPLHEYPPFDFFATIAPFDFEHTVDWHFVLEKSPEAVKDSKETESELIDRAKELRGRVDAGEK